MCKSSPSTSSKYHVFLLGLVPEMTYYVSVGMGAEIARPDNAAPYRKGGHRETCFSVPVDAHNKFVFALGVLYELLIEL